MIKNNTFIYENLSKILSFSGLITDILSKDIKLLEVIQPEYAVRLNGNISFYKNIFEKNCLPKLSKIKQLQAFKHNGFWACMDTLREKKELTSIWHSDQKAWKVWIK